MAKKAVIVFAVVVLAVIGATIGYFVTKKSTDSSTSTAGNNGTSSSNSNASGGSSKTSGTTGGSSTISFTNSSGSGDVGTVSTITSDPTAQKYELSAFAIGDWGATTYSKNGSCCSRRSDYSFNAFDRHAELGVAKLMGLTAAVQKPKVIMGHGDNFYWEGILDDTDQAYRFEATFEDKYTDKALIDVPWVNVMGNHDYGGGSYVCSDGSIGVECKSTEELLTAINTKFKLQAGYKSPNNDRWMLTDHFYVHTIKDGDVSVDIFNLDTNDADTHAADQICCQCYGYSEGDKEKKCKQATRGHKHCCGGDTSMYDQCMKQFKEWGDEAKAKLVEGVKKSTATWKIVNSHYSPYNHYGEAGASEWIQTLQSIDGIQLWINGHTHGEKHDFGAFNMHFIENGAGGGIQSEAASGIPKYASSYIKNLWTAGGLTDGTLDGNTYGFFEVAASKEWLKVRFLTFDSNWKITKDDNGLEKGTIGGVAAKHCWYIPVDGTLGKECS
uniref:Calcineurin-like phosphoesterase domain-containing protein n=1 Tax=Globisporangium ultimum (strain ATCC 200006 / CBS 805.95 / DAOM BR144) TaxID=431595 RepID=K3WNU3_GLOUD